MELRLSEGHAVSVARTLYLTLKLNKSLIYKTETIRNITFEKVGFICHTIFVSSIKFTWQIWPEYTYQIELRFWYGSN